MENAHRWIGEQVDDRNRWVESKLRTIFLGSVGLCALIVVLLMVLPRHVARVPWVLQVSLLPILLWALSVTAYAFRALWSVAQGRRVKLVDLLQRDPLTGAHNEACLLEQLKEESRRAMKTGVGAGFGFVRLAGLEKVNESFGHTAGNLVLREIAQGIRNIMGETGILCRLAGQEFVVFMPQTKLEVAERMLSKIRKHVEDYSLDLGKRGTIGGISASVGLAAYPVEGESGPDIIRAAQAKLEPEGEDPSDVPTPTDAREVRRILESSRDRRLKESSLALKTREVLRRQDGQDGTAGGQ